MRFEPTTPGFRVRWSAGRYSSNLALMSALLVICTGNAQFLGPRLIGSCGKWVEGPVGFEPTTPGLKVRSSTAELRAPLRSRSYLLGPSSHNRLRA